ncbi:NADPH-dependent FMN reductase [Treponema sp. JC4]|uniref:flavodoxin family protein n=1 Tax=Treponema sp. JC4 TaxID=1124982 RepID=UPI00025B0D40|nr:flavodoxin family protein [Treponema sp. JC4]EID86062.1 NADPH-dependent FMN reductase [Treponema sp. JC4]
MNILVLNGSPRKNGNVAKTLRRQLEKLTASVAAGTDSNEGGCQVIWEDVCDLSFDFCKGCMACRSKSDCVMQLDDAHKIACEIKNCDMIFVGTPVYWGNMNGKLKSLFDRLVGVMMAESKMGIPRPIHKGKKAVIVTSCTTPFPFNYICGQSIGAVRAVKEILKSSGFKVVRKVNISNTKRRGL